VGWLSEERIGLSFEVEEAVPHSMGTVNPPVTQGPAVTLPEPTRGCIDLPTLIAIAIVAYVVSNVLHEAVGHGGACLLEGCQVIVISSVHAECSCDSRLVAAGGTLVNLVAGVLGFPALRLMESRSWSWPSRYFVWLLMTVNLLQGAGYFLFSGAGNIGDWAAFIEGFTPTWAYRAGLFVLGTVLYTLFIGLSLKELARLLGPASEERVRRAVVLTVVPYVAGGLLSCVASLFNPVGMVLIAISAAAATFGGTSGLAWMAQLMKVIPFPGAPPMRIQAIPRSWSWIAVAFVLVVIFLGVIGPGVRFG
jgi:hypothetical protein